MSCILSLSPPASARGFTHGYATCVPAGKRWPGACAKVTNGQQSLIILIFADNVAAGKGAGNLLGGMGELSTVAGSVLPALPVLQKKISRLSQGTRFALPNGLPCPAERAVRQGKAARPATLCAPARCSRGLKAAAAGRRAAAGPGALRQRRTPARHLPPPPRP